MAAQQVLRRKAAGAAAGVPRDAPGGEGRPRPEAERALALALARAAEEEMRLPLRVAGTEARRLSLSELLELPETGALLAVVEGPGESLGCMALGPAVLAAVIEHRTIGRVTPAAPLPRRPTRTDAAMSAGLIDRALAEFARALEHGPEGGPRGWAAGYRYASFLEDPRPLGLLLEDVTYRAFRAEVLLGAQGAKRGHILLALPAVARSRALPARPDAMPGGAGGAEEAAAAAEQAWARALEAAVMASPAQLDAVLDRLSLPLAAVMALRPGALLPLPGAALERLSIEGRGGRRVAEGRLGQSKGMRAVRLTPLEGG